MLISHLGGGDGLLCFFVYLYSGLSEGDECCVFEDNKRSMDHIYASMYYLQNP